MVLNFPKCLSAKRFSLGSQDSIPRIPSSERLHASKLSGMTLNEFVSSRKRQIFENLSAGEDPSVGEFSSDLLKEGRAKGLPTMGTTRFEPTVVTFEYIYSDATSSATILSVKLETPERVVFLPVPEWVIESIWQGDIDGSFHFESDAFRLLREFEEQLTPGMNHKWFGTRPARRRE